MRQAVGARDLSVLLDALQECRPQPLAVGAYVIPVRDDEDEDGKPDGDAERTDSQAG